MGDILRCPRIPVHRKVRMSSGLPRSSSLQMRSVEWQRVPSGNGFARRYGAVVFAHHLDLCVQICNATPIREKLEEQTIHVMCWRLSREQAAIDHESLARPTTTSFQTSAKTPSYD